MNSPLNVLAIGSCRVFRPLRRLHDAEHIELVNYNSNFWFTHSSGAARQYVDVMLGHKVVPVELRRAALESVLEFPGEMAAGIPQVDVVVVEISTLKQYRIADCYLNAHKIYGILSEAGIPHQPVLGGQTDGLPDGHVLKQLVMEHTTQQEIRDDLLSVRSQVRAPVMVVDHLYSLMQNGEPPAERVKLTEQLRSISEQDAIPFFSTKEMILEYGPERALLDQNHYRADFEAVAGERMHPALAAAANSEWA